MESDEVAKSIQPAAIGPETLSGENLMTHLLAISHQMAGMRSVAPLLSYVVDEVMALVGAERGYIVLLGEDGALDFKVRRHADGTNIESDVDSISGSVLDEVIRTKESVVVRNALMDPQFGGAMSVMAMQLRSIMCSPLITQDRIIGAVYVENRSKSGRFSKEDAVPLEFFSNHAAVAIENAHLNENLETLVEERTSELVEAKEAAEAATRAKSTFLSTITHELRTPMNGVLGMASLLMDTPLNEEQKELADTIRASGDTLLTLINDILDFSKIEAGKVDLEPVSFQLENCIEQAMNLVMPTAAAKRLHLAYYIDDNVPNYLTQDITRIRQILTNLLSNAVKFTEQGQVEVYVSLVDSSLSDLNEVEIKFAVSDTGIGIPTDRMSRLFQPFSQAESSTNRHYGGTGLGLVICKRLCELMGGSIDVSSELGVGTTFSFSITVQVGSEPENSRDRNYEWLAGKRILLVTSNSLIERSVQQSLQGCRVVLERHSSLPTDANVLDDVSALIIDATVPSPSFTGLEISSSALGHSENPNGHQLGVSVAPEPEHSNPTSLGQPFDLAAAGIHKPTILLTYWGDLFPPFKSQYPVATIPLPIKSAQLRCELANITGNHIEPKSPEQERSLFDVTMAQAYPLRILLAEDNIVNQKVALRMLERYGYQAEMVENGLDAVDALQESDYDLILMDVQMPKMDGIEATQKIRTEIPPERQPYIVAMTANATSDARERYLNADMDNYISKPVSVGELQAVLKIAALRRTNKID